MRLKIFDVIDDTLQLLEDNHQLYVSVEDEIGQTLEKIFGDDQDEIIDIHSRIKTKESLREKIIRNRMYIDHNDAQGILSELSDVIGFSIECRFIADEYKILDRLRTLITCVGDDGYFSHEEHANLFLDLGSQQPQIQKNGFSIYRIDGYVLRGNRRINFELQIKALVNAFWGDIEHKLVYKNTNYYVYDEFMKDILSSIKANLAIIDRQLSIVFTQMSAAKENESPILDEASFEVLLSKAINDIFAVKMNQSIGFTMNLKQISTILGHYIFFKDIQNGSKRQDQMTGLFHAFKRLNSVEIDFENEIVLDPNFTNDDPFIDCLGKYLVSIINEDYDWFVFLRMLFVIQPGNYMEDFNMFLIVIKSYMVDEYWLHTSFVQLELDEAKTIQNDCLLILAESLCSIGDIRIVYNDSMTHINKAFVHFIEMLERSITSIENYHEQRSNIKLQWFKTIGEIFEKDIDAVCKL